LFSWKKKKDKSLERKIFIIYFVIQSTFMDKEQPPLETLQDIKRIMERSSRFISLSGLSGVGARLFALAGAWVANSLLSDYHNHGGGAEGLADDNTNSVRWRIMILAVCVLTGAIASSFYFTWKKAKRNKLSIWDPTSKKLLINLVIPLGAGGIFVMGLLYHDAWHFVAPACLIFYGLALVNASKYTLSDIRYIGILEILIGGVNLYFVEYGLYFWAVGFGLLHIIYGFIMWWKYDYKLAHQV
jgi:hypothetical protein